MSYSEILARLKETRQNMEHKRTHFHGAQEAIGRAEQFSPSSMKKASSILRLTSRRRRPRLIVAIMNPPVIMQPRQQALPRPTLPN